MILYTYRVNVFIAIVSVCLKQSLSSFEMYLPVELIKSIDRTQESESKRQLSDVLVSNIASIP